MEIKEIGSFHLLDSEGYIQNPCQYPVLQSEYSDAISGIIDWYKKLYGDIVHSIYLRGSVAKGQAIHYISDIDTIALTKRPVKENEKAMREEVGKVICSKYTFVTDIEMHFEYLNSINQKWLQFLLATQCVCVYGEDIIPSLMRFKPGKDAFAHINYIIKDINEVIKELQTESNCEEIKSICSWIMKRVVRSGYELVMERDNSYSRDLFPCYQRFSVYYPDMTKSMEQALGLAIEPTDVVSKIVAILNELKPFLKNEIDNLKLQKLNLGR